MICIDECYFLVFVKRMNWKGVFLGHDVHELQAVKFISLNVSLHLKKASYFKNKNLNNIYEKLGQIIKVENELLKYLSFGFFTCETYDLSKPLHLQNDANYDSTHFIWNANIIRQLAQRGVSDNWMDKVVQGFFGMFQCPNSDSTYALISRRSSEMGGTRFISRGINEDGYVSNYVETEQVLIKGQHIATYIQIRGSVPLFWRQTGVVAPMELTKSVEFAIPSYVKHINRLNNYFGDIYCVNLMSATKSGEGTLSADFKKIVGLMGNPRLQYDHIDFHGITEGTNFIALNNFMQNHEKFINENGCHLFEVTFSDSGALKVAFNLQLEHQSCQKADRHN